MIAIPILPCASIDDMLTFYSALGFRRTYRQTRPNPYLAMSLDDIELHFFGMPDFDPANSYGTCGLQVPDTCDSAPRLLRRTAGDLREGSSVRHPADDQAAAPQECRRSVRVHSDRPGRELDPQLSREGEGVSRVVGRDRDTRTRPGERRRPRRQSRRRGQAAKILDGALARTTDASTRESVEALAYRTELAVTLQDPNVRPPYWSGCETSR